MDNIIEAKNLVYRYTDEEGVEITEENAAVNGISLEIQRGSFTAIIGHNGSGKSTLAKLLSGVYIPSEGKVKINVRDGRVLDVSEEKDNFEIRKQIGMVFQNPDNQLVATIVEDDVAFAPENLGLSPTEIRKRVDEALENVGLSEYSKHDTHKLSGGQKQRVAIAGILAMHPECIIFDESTAMLDPKGRNDIIDTIIKLRDEGITIVLITHYMNEAALADKIVVVNKGQILTEGKPNKVFAQRKLLFGAGLEPPQSASLVQGLKDSGININTDVIDVDGAVKAIEQAFKKCGISPKKEGNINA